MAQRKVYRLGDLQLRIMKVLWKAEPASVSTVHEELSAETPLAYTTVATMLRKMEARGLVKHRKHGRRFVYSAAVPAEAVTRSMANDVIDRLFEGNLADMVSHLLSTREISPGELRELEELIATRRKRDARRKREQR